MGQPDIPSSAPTSSQLEPARPPLSYRGVQPLPAQLLDHCTVCIEEQLFSQAISLLLSAVTSGNGTPRPVYVPPTPHLSLLATLVVHPSMTTRTTSKEKQVAANDALRYLHHLNSLTAADASGLAKALQFRDAGSSRSKRARTRVSDVSSDDETEDPGRIRSSYAKRDSVFANAEDFWATVGWAFNCSVAHQARWERWKLWLGFMLDVLEDDLDSKHHQARESTEGRDKVLSKSLIARYLAPFIDQGRNPKRRIMRAILADGTQASLNLFPSIFTNETAPPKVKEETKLGAKRYLDLDEGEFGDYFDSDSEPDTTPGQKQRSGRNSARLSINNRIKQEPPTPDNPGTPNPSTSAASSPLASHGGVESLRLRLRLLTLLANISSLAPALFLDPEDLFDLYTEFLRPLPLPVFSFFILPSKPVGRRAMDANSLASLIQMLLRPLLSSAAPVSNANSLTAERFATHFAPYTANVSSVGENARAGICVEGLLRLLWTEGVLGNASDNVRQSVRQAVKEGVKLREEKASGDGRRKSAGKNAEEWEFLATGGERMRCLLNMF